MSKEIFIFRENKAEMGKETQPNDPTNNCEKLINRIRNKIRLESAEKNKL